VVDIKRDACLWRIPNLYPLFFIENILEIYIRKQLINIQIHIK